MVSINIGDHGHHRCKVQKRGITFVGFGHQITTLAKARVGTGTVKQTANNKGGVQSIFGQQARSQTGSRGLTMRSRNGNAKTKTHQFSQHFSARHYRNTRFTRGHDFRVICRHSGRRDHHIAALHVRCIMPCKYFGTQIGQTTSHSIFPQIRTGYGITQIR